ncbi:MAG: 16S rRNA (uracil(1498)-N(3))-methyltransferase [Caldisericia bacterium]|nr:16S rRNA (uracil(1498)-N(3))-methyltransferase [Caldisericia bacterium]
MTELRNFFINPEDIKDNFAIIKGSDFHHIKNVLRGKVGTKLYAITLSGKYEAEITDISVDSVKIKLLNLIEPRVEPKYKICLLQAIPKGSKMDLIVEKAVELGVSKIYPFYSERVNFSLDKEKEINKIERWKRKAIEASKQCKRLAIPEINEIIDFDELLNLTEGSNNDLKIIFWELEEKNSLSKLLDKTKVYPDSSIFILIGPEGGFSINEVKKAVEHNFTPCSLGKWILRTETAGPFAVGLISYILWEREE